MSCAHVVHITTKKAFHDVERTNYKMKMTNITYLHILYMKMTRANRAKLLISLLNMKLSDVLIILSPSS